MKEADDSYALIHDDQEESLEHLGVIEYAGTGMTNQHGQPEGTRTIMYAKFEAANR
jgi:hypothetical protein